MAALAGIATIRASFAGASDGADDVPGALAIQERLGDEGAIASTLISTGNVLICRGFRRVASYTATRPT
jgi:hypothetical protein